MFELLFGSQIIAIITFVGTAFWLYKVYTKVQDARIKAALEENDRLCRRIAELEAQLAKPSELLAQLNLYKEASAAESAKLKKEAEAARDEGNVKLQAEKEAALKTQQKYSKDLDEARKKAEAYRQAWEESEKTRKDLKESSSFQNVAMHSIYDAINASSIQFSIPTPGPLYFALGDNCLRCRASSYKCNVCKRPKCDAHMSMADGLFTCQECYDNVRKTISPK